MINVLDINPGRFMVSNAKNCTDGTVVYNIVRELMADILTS